MSFDFSDISVDELEDNDWDGAVSAYLMIQVQREVENIDWDAMPSDQLVLGPELLSFVKDDSKPPPRKKAKQQPLLDSMRKFQNRSGFTPEETDAAKTASFYS